MSNNSVLPSDLKNELIDFCKEMLFDSMFGDGMEDDYIMNGMGFKGLNNMTDEELIETALTYTGDDEDLIIRAKTELDIHNVLAD